MFEICLLFSALCRGAVDDDPPPPPAAPTVFEFPCERYAAGLRGGGNFGVRVTGAAPFHGTYHLAEDVWLPSGTPVHAVADGVVRYSAFSPTWTDARGVVHWNLGNVIVIEHELDVAEEGLTHVCSFYVHLSAQRDVAVGDRVTRGQRIGAIGRHKSDENGLYPAHLHFGIHRGPYVQITDTFRRELEHDAKTTGLPVADAQGNVEFVKAAITAVELVGDAAVRVKLEGGLETVMSLEIGSTAPKDPPPDIMHWCVGYGEKATVDEWIKPSEWIARHAPSK